MVQSLPAYADDEPGPEETMKSTAEKMRVANVVMVGAFLGVAILTLPALAEFGLIVLGLASGAWYVKMHRSQRAEAEEPPHA